MKLLFAFVFITMSFIANSQTLLNNNTCILKSMHVKTEAYFLISSKNDTILKQLNHYDSNGNRVSAKAFFLTGEPGDADTLIYDPQQVLIKKISYSPSGRIKFYDYYTNDDLGNNISISTINAKGRIVYRDTLVYKEDRRLDYVQQLTSNKDLPKLKKFFYNKDGALEKEIYNYDEKDSTIITYTYNKAAQNDSVLTAQKPVNRTCGKVQLPDKIFIKYGKPKNDINEIREELSYYQDGLLLKSNISGVPKRAYLKRFMYYKLYD